MSTQEVRLAAENRSYRLVETEDLVVGAEIYMVEAEVIERDSSYPPSRIILSADPIRDRDGVPYVYYYLPLYDLQCFVPLAHFLGNERPDINHHHYWIPRR